MQTQYEPRIEDRACTRVSESTCSERVISGSLGIFSPTSELDRDMDLLKYSNLLTPVRGTKRKKKRAVEGSHARTPRK
jgi:hypothetical protein